MEKGFQFVIESDKIASLSDIPAWCHFTGNRLLKTENENGLYRFQIEKLAEKGLVSVIGEYE